MLLFFIIDVLGDKVLGIEHIGRTLGLVAKPIIDIIVGVQDLDEVPNFVIPLSKIEYEYVHLPEFKTNIYKEERTVY